MDFKIIDQIILNALHEDMPEGDITTDNLIPDNHKSKARFVAKEDGVLSGLDVCRRVFELVGGSFNLTFNYKNGDKIKKGDVIGLIDGDTKTLLKGERVALNLLQRMCGIATTTSKFTKELVGDCKILDTRKTTPNLRYIEKMAVLDGGGTNHRYSLSDMAMIKDNHIVAAGSITKAVSILKSKITKKVEVEVETREEFLEAEATEADIIMLDNMSNEDMLWCVKNNDKLKHKLEASGNMTVERIKEVSSLGVDFISVGALTHSPRALDISLKFYDLK